MVFDKLSKSISVSHPVARMLSQYFLQLTQALHTEQLINSSEVLFDCICLHANRITYFKVVGEF